MTRPRSSTDKQTAPMPFGEAEAKRAITAGFEQLEATIRGWHRPVPWLSVAAFTVACCALLVAVAR